MRPHPDARERRTIAVAIRVSAVALALAYVVIPFVQRSLARASEIELRRAQVGRMGAVVSRQPELERAVQARGAALDAYGTRVLRGPSPALIGAELQRLLQDEARASGVSVSRLDVTGIADSSGGPTLSMAATLSAAGDVYGLARLLRALADGPVLTEVRELSIQSTSGLRGDVLQLSLGVRAPFVAEERK